MEEEPRIYQLCDKDDESKCYADVIILCDGQVVVKWHGKVKSLVVFNNLDDFENTSVKNHNRVVLNPYGFSPREIN